MPLGVPTRAVIQSGESVPSAPRIASGTTQATDATAVTPDADAFIIVSERPVVAGMITGFRCRVKDEAVIAGATSLVAVLRAYNATTLTILSGDVLVVGNVVTAEWGASAPAAGVVVALNGNTQPGTFAAGDEIQLRWYESDGAGGAAVIDGGDSRPSLQFLGWGLVSDTEQVI